jgi:hypothetical protein
MKKKIKKIFNILNSVYLLIQVILVILKINNYLKVTWVETFLPTIIIVTVYLTVTIMIFIFIKIIQKVYGVSDEEMNKRFWDKL